MLKPNIEWTEAQVIWLKKHFMHTKNADILIELSKRGDAISQRTMIRMARKLGLKKSTNFIHKCNRKALEKMHEHNKETGYMECQLGAKRQWQKLKEEGRTSKSCWKKGHVPTWDEKARLEKAHESRRKTMARERRRIDLGLEQKTGLLLIKHYDRRDLYLRSMARKKGYVVFRTEGVIYYDKNTVREERFEKRLNDKDILLMTIGQRGQKII